MNAEEGAVLSAHPAEVNHHWWNKMEGLQEIRTLVF
jgi:hypothetical protein